MIIVSQDKSMTVNYNNICVLGINEKTEKNILSKTNNGDTQLLGEYKTAKRAKEVLQEINYWKSKFELFKVISKEKKKEMIGLFVGQRMNFDLYEMPKE